MWPKRVKKKITVEDLMSDVPEFANPSRLLTREQAMQFLGIGETKLWELTYQGRPDDRLVCYKIGKLPRYPFDQLVWWLEKRKV